MLATAWQPDFVVTAGDNYYGPAGGSGNTRYDESTGAYYCAFIKEAVTTGKRCGAGTAIVNRFFPTPGNHDWSDAGPSGWDTYLNYFTLPGTGVESSHTAGNERYSDFVQGPVHFFMLNSDSSEPSGNTRGSTQGRWLQTQLASSSSLWNVVIFHHALYSSGSVHGSADWMRWPFAAWGANVVISGHEHTYERIERDGIVFFLNGLGGGPRYPFGKPVLGSVARYNANWGAMRVVATKTRMHFEFRSIDGSADGTLQDQYTLSLAPSWCPRMDLPQHGSGRNEECPIWLPFVQSLRLWYKGAVALLIAEQIEG
jgi:tartrate-resistant acid phosphatase type 5